MRIQGIALIMVGVLHMFRQAMPSVEAAFVRAPMPLAFASVNKRWASISLDALNLGEELISRPLPHKST